LLVALEDYGALTSENGSGNKRCGDLH
jgi:hypothetical protein